MAKDDKGKKKIMTLFGTRPEVIKLAPIIQELEAQDRQFETVNVTSAQHKDLLYPFVQMFGIRLDHNLQVMEPNQTLSQVCSRVLSSLDPILAQEKPDLILVQGDTTTAMAGALAGFHRLISVGHVEAGLRSGDSYNPYPEEMNRRIITQLASLHFAATSRNRDNLLAEGVRQENIFVTGNPVVDSLKAILERPSVSPSVEQLLYKTSGLRRIVLTTHRRESFGEVMADNLRALRSFIQSHKDVALIFPVHPNPSVQEVATNLLSGQERIHLLNPLAYFDFISLLSKAWLIISDSGGVQEEAPTLGKPLLILRENTERPEAVDSGAARLVGNDINQLMSMLEGLYCDDTWFEEVKSIQNPFGQGHSGKRIVQIISQECWGSADAWERVC